ncbi:MAG: alpha/beta fold hydrolase [Tepidiformaceae bacterium]
MDRIAVVDGELEAQSMGSGEPVLFIPGVAIADSFAPLLTEPALAQDYQLISYHRRGYAGSSPHQGACSIAEQAADALAILRHYGVAAGHIVGHSYGGAIALQMALDAPTMVHSLALLEPGLFQVPATEQLMAALGPVTADYENGDAQAAMKGFLTAVFNPGYEPALEKTLPAGWFQQVVADADTLFKVELPAIGEWAFTEEHAAGVNDVPVLAVLGAESGPFFAEGFALMQTWWPDAETIVLPNSSHTLQMANPSAMAAGLARFFRAHPI